MEKGQWLKTLGLGLMVLVAMYILVPSAIEIVEGPDTPTEAVQQKAHKKAAQMDVVFDAADAEQAAAAAQALGARAKAAGVAMERFGVDNNGRVQVLLSPGGSATDVRQLAIAQGVPAVYAFDAVLPPPATPPAPDAPARWTEARALFGKPVPGDVAPVAGASVVLTGDTPEVTGAPETGDLLVTVDGLVRAAVTRDGGTKLRGLAPDGDDVGAADWDRAKILLRAGPLPTTLTPYVAPSQADAAPATEEAPHVSAVPPWLKSILAPYKINLGLDLQGGLDLTLAVELDEAVLAQVGRDASMITEQANKDDLKVVSAHRDSVDPTIHIVTEAPLTDVKAWMAKKFRAYEYQATQTADGGTDQLFHMKDTEQKAVQDSATEQVLETLRKRVDATGVKEPTIVKKGVGRINIQLPGKVDLQSAIDAIGTTAVLEFRLLDEKFDDSQLEKMLGAARKALPADQYADDDILNRWLHDAKRPAEMRMKAEDLVLWEYDDKGPDHNRKFPLVLQSQIMLTGADIATAGVNWDQNQQPYVSIEFKSRGATEFCKVTGENVGKRFAIVLDNEIRSAPNIRERICGGGARIEMGGSEDPLAEANTLALVLRTGSLNAPVSIGQVNEVGATLGRDAIIDGTMAMVIGSFLVFIYMGLWYRISGLVANFTLLLNVLMVLSALAMFGATLTLPGICGIALTVGMAVDANIIVYERIREELRLGLNSRKAVDVGFEKAFNAIIDAHVTQAIAGIVLYSYGAGPIKGFAVAMIVGIATTLFTSLVASRVLMEHLTRNSTARLSI